MVLNFCWVFELFLELQVNALLLKLLIEHDAVASKHSWFVPHQELRVCTPRSNPISTHFRSQGHNIGFASTCKRSTCLIVNVRATQTYIFVEMQ